MTAQASIQERLFFKESGPANAPTLVFLHGGGGSGWMWTPQVEALSQDYHCLVPDLPGHGRSTGQTFTMTGAAKQVADLIRQHTHDGKATVIGLSLGAQVLVELLTTAPQVVERALISSALVHRTLPDWLSSRGVLRWSYRLGVAPLKHLAWYTRLNMRYAAGVPDSYFNEFKADYDQLDAELFAQITAENMHFRLPQTLQQATMPVLVVVGRREYAVMHQSARDLVRALPQARGVVVDAGRSTAENHNWNINAPEMFTRVVRAWINDQPLPSELIPL